jgi:hypothetical protein
MLAKTLIAAQRDFQEQKGRLQEIEAAGQDVIFYPKFHYELNLIKLFWCSCKVYTQGHCTFTYAVYEKSSPKPSNRYQLRLSINITIVMTYAYTR